MLTILLVASPRIIKLHPTALLSVCLSVCHWVHSTGTEDFRARYPAPPPLQSRQAQGCRTVWGYGELSPTKFWQNFNLCTQMIPRVLDFVPTKFWDLPAGLSRESWISSTSRWHLGSDLISDGAVAGASPRRTERHKPLRRHLLVRTYFCNSGVLLLPQPWHSMYSSRLKSFLKKHLYFHTSAFFLEEV